MSFRRTDKNFRKMVAWASLTAAAILSGCATNSPENAALGINDPFESLNRDVHDFNKGADRLVLRPTSQAYDAVTPEIIQVTLRNTLNNLEAPRDFVNHVLSGDLGPAGRTLLRFTINTTLGFGGVMDVAGHGGIEKEDADFGKTLATWGAGQGVYYEAPLLGPTTVRHTAGRVVDAALAPTTYVFAPFSSIGATTIRTIDARATNAEIIDDVLYKSEDSYAMTRSIYLQRRETFINDGKFDIQNAVPLD